MYFGQTSVGLVAWVGEGAREGLNKCVCVPVMHDSSQVCYQQLWTGSGVGACGVYDGWHEFYILARVDASV